MRLSKNDLSGIVGIINQEISLENAELRLFGSRANDQGKGGDIDLLLIVADKSVYQTVAFQKVKILIEIQDKIGEQKIDLILATREDLMTDPFLKLILPSSLILHKW